MKTIKQGDKGFLVYVLKYALYRMGYNVLTNTLFDEGTTAAVKVYQAKHGFKADGIVGPISWAPIVEAFPVVIDVYHKSIPADLSKLPGIVKGVIAKAVEGVGAADSELVNFHQAAKANGQIFGAYLFFRFKQDWQAQADNYLSVCRAAGIDFKAPGTLPPIIDVEYCQLAHNDDTVAENAWIDRNPHTCADNLAKALAYLKAQTGCADVILYSFKSFMRDTLANTTAFGQYKLWISAFQFAIPGLPAGFDDYLMHQFAEKIYPDYIGNCDLSVWNDTYSNMRKYVGLG